MLYQTNTLKSVLLVLFLFNTGKLQAFSGSKESPTLLPSITVTAERWPTEINKTAHATQVITADEIQEKHQGSALKALQSMTGVELNRQGGEGKASSLFLRGANSHHVLVLVDGVEVNDPISPTRAFDFSRLNLSGVERIEVVKGPQSVLYGSDALAGVVHIITRQSSEQTKVKWGAELGSFATQKYDLNVSSSKHRFNYASSVRYMHTEGFSAAEPAGDLESDGHEQLNLGFNLGAALTESQDLQLNLRYVLAQSDLDSRGGLGGDDPNQEEKTEQASAAFKWKYQVSPQLYMEFFTHHNQIRRDNRDRADTIDPTIKDDYFKGRNTQLGLVSYIELNSQHKFILGVEYEEEAGESHEFVQRQVHSEAAYLQMKNSGQNSFSVLGVRYDQSSQGDVSQTTARWSPGYFISQTDTKLRASVGTGFKTPSLFNLFDPTYGNPDLKPEQVFNYELGIDQGLLSHQHNMSLTYFKSKYKDLLAFDSMAAKTINLAKSEIEGLELELKSRLNATVHLGLGWTHLFKFRDETTGSDLVRRSKDSFSVYGEYNPSSRWNYVFAYRYVGAREDFDAVNFNLKELPTYDILDLSVNHKWRAKTQLYLHLNNLLDENYQEIDGYQTAGFSLYTGIKQEL